jgi:hypothetical protein
MRRHGWTWMVLATVLLAGCGGRQEKALPMLAPGVTPTDMEARVEQFAPAVIGFDTTLLEPWQKEVVAKLIEASDVLHGVYAVQVSPDNPKWRAELDTAQGLGKAATLTYFDIMVGPWDRLKYDAPFLDVGPKPAGAGFYPPDLTPVDFDAWLEAHPEDRPSFTSNFTVIRRNGDDLVAVPYSEAYHDALQKAADLLRQAADVSQNGSLARFLRSRADAFLSNDYYQSDMDWMDIDNSAVEPTIGPYEVYEDQLMGLKASFESFITVADSAASAELDVLKSHLKSLEEHLPIEDRYKNTDRGFESPMKVVDVAYTAGEARSGVATIAFNLPNDERVRAAKGSKKVMLRNVSLAKFNRILVPIAERVLAPDIVSRIQFQPWFTNVLMHELAHGLGPGFITVDGQRTTVNQALRDRYSAIEEAKADVTGLHNLTVLADEGVYEDFFVRQAFAGHLADLVRAVRFGANEAHGQAALLQFDWYLDKGAIQYDTASSKFNANLQAMILANRQLATELLTLEAQGDYGRAGALLKQYGTVPDELQKAIDSLDGVPVDIRPEYPAHEFVSEWGGSGDEE